MLFYDSDYDFNYDYFMIFFLCCRSEEIVMPAEQVGLVRDNYLWKVRS